MRLVFPLIAGIFACLGGSVVSEVAPEKQRPLQGWGGHVRGGRGQRFVRGVVRLQRHRPLPAVAGERGPDVRIAAVREGRDQS